MKKTLGHNSKKDFLDKPVEHIDITKFDARPIISSMEKMSFVSRETANAANIYNDMIKDKNCTICNSECCFGDWKNYSENKNWTEKSLGKNGYARKKAEWKKKHSK